MFTIAAKWNHERFEFSIPDPDTTKLVDLRRLISEATHLDIDAFKIIHSGAVMKEDNAPISAFRLRDKTTLTIIGAAAPKQPPPTLQRSEQSVVATIESEMNGVRNNLAPSLEAFASYLEHTGQQPISPAHEKEHARLGELLLQSLLRLDGITTEGEWEDARRERKGAVKEVQELLDRLDDAWKSRGAT